jgi:hypothetical protein
MLKKYLDFNPVRSLGALSVLIQAIVTVIALRNDWDGKLVLAVDGATTAFTVFLGSFFVEARTVATKALEAYSDASKIVQGTTQDK